MIKSLASLSLCLLLTACAANEPLTEPAPPRLPPAAASYVTGMVRVSDLVAESTTDRLVIDLQNTRDGFWFEPNLDVGAIDIVCPSGRVMNIESWMINLASDKQQTFTNNEDFVVYSSTSSPREPNSAPVCDEGCSPEREPNGTWSCICGGL